MPGGDRTGPLGMGSMTGRAAGYCAGFGMPGYAHPMPRIGYGMGRGRGLGGRGFGGGGRGWRHWFYATGQPGWMRLGGPAVPYGYGKPDPETEKQALRSQAEDLQAELESIQNRLSEIETAAE